jgi:mono/diheme cytochrome c family protein
MTANRLGPPALAALIGSALLCCATPGAGGEAIRSDGERIYRGHCASCHRLRAPSEHTRARWEWAIKEFGARAHLTDEQRPVLLEWLQARASDAR